MAVGAVCHCCYFTVCFNCCLLFPRKQGKYDISFYYTTQALRGPITKSTNQNALLPVQYSLSIGPGIVPNDPTLVSL